MKVEVEVEVELVSGEGGRATRAAPRSGYISACTEIRRQLAPTGSLAAGGAAAAASAAGAGAGSGAGGTEVAEAAEAAEAAGTILGSAGATSGRGG